MHAYDTFFSNIILYLFLYFILLLIKNFKNIKLIIIIFFLLVKLSLKKGLINSYYKDY